MKKVLCIVLSLVLVLALAACASPAASNAESSSETTTSDKSSAVTVVDASKSGHRNGRAKDSYTVARSIRICRGIQHLFPERYVHALRGSRYHPA